MKVPRRGVRLEHRDVAGQRGVECLGDALDRRSTEDVDGDDVRQRMDAGVRSAGDREALDPREDPSERLGDSALDRPLAGLRRPAPERGAVVLDRQRETHVRDA